MKTFILIVFSIYFVATFLINVLHLVSLEKDKKKEAAIFAIRVIINFILIILFTELRHYL